MKYVYIILAIIFVLPLFIIQLPLALLYILHRMALRTTDAFFKGIDTNK